MTVVEGLIFLFYASFLFPPVYSNNILVGKRGRKRPLERSSLGWESTIKMDIVT
jgi:hypothetical protein